MAYAIVLWVCSGGVDQSVFNRSFPPRCNFCAPSNSVIPFIL